MNKLTSVLQSEGTAGGLVRLTENPKTDNLKECIHVE